MSRDALVSLAQGLYRRVQGLFGRSPWLAAPPAVPARAAASLSASCPCPGGQGAAGRAGPVR
eukprot:357961-Chlamydomonas_euryale.AAC.6